MLGMREDYKTDCRGENRFNLSDKVHSSYTVIASLYSKLGNRRLGIDSNLVTFRLKNVYFLSG
jgi:hypothetical protein